MVEGVYCSNVTNNSTAFTNRAIVIATRWAEEMNLVIHCKLLRALIARMLW